MNVVIKLLILIVFSIFIYYVESAELHCCGPTGTILLSKRCKDGTNISISCEEFLIKLENNSYTSYIIGSDKDGEYLDEYVAGYTIRQPYFCTGQMYYSMSNRTAKVAMVCSSSRKWYKDVEIHTDATTISKLYRMFYYLSFVFNAISMICLLAVAAIYHLLPEVHDRQGICYFHLVLVAGIGHFTLLYLDLFDMDGLLPNLCITNTYLLMYLVLCAFSWCTVICYNTWRNTMNYHADDDVLLRNYKLYGYGVPVLLLVFAWIHVHLNDLSNLQLNLVCHDHQKVIYQYYVAIPLLFSLLLNFIMFIHSQIRIWHLHSIQIQDTKLSLKIIKYRIFMNAKFFFIMGIPWTFCLMVYFIDNILESNFWSTLIQLLAALVVLGEGIPIFLILVVFQKRVLRGMANRWFVNTNIFPARWKTMKASETEEEKSENEPSPARVNAEVKYNVNHVDVERNEFNESAIINF